MIFRISEFNPRMADGAFMGWVNPNPAELTTEDTEGLEIKLIATTRG
jgi:hypothetical protein